MSLSRADRLAQRRELLVLDASLARVRLAVGTHRLMHEVDPRVLAGRAFERVRKRPSVLLPMLFRLAWGFIKRRRKA